MAKKILNGLDLTSQRLINLADPSAATDAANKQYVDNNLAGLRWKQPVVVATTTNGTLATAFANGQTIDGYTLVTADRILLKNQTAQTDNGIYTVNASGAPTRALDADSTAELESATVFVIKGTANADKAYTQTTNAPVIGTDNIVWAQFGAGTTYIAGAGLTESPAGTFNVVATDTSLTVNADDVGVRLATNPGLQVSSGLLLKLDTNPGLVLGAGGVKALLNGATLTLGASGLSVTQPLLKYSATFGDNSATTFTITHSLGTTQVIIAIYVDSTGEEVECDIVQRNTNDVHLAFAVAPTTNQYRIVVLG